MSARDELAELIGRTDDSLGEIPLHADEWARRMADAILAAGYLKPRTISAAAELDALGFQSVVIDAYGTPYVCERHATDGTRNEWKPSGMSHLEESDDVLIHGPVTAVYEP